jgi:hypothetical protein
MPSRNTIRPSIAVAGAVLVGLMGVAELTSGQLGVSLVGLGLIATAAGIAAWAIHVRRRPGPLLEIVDGEVVIERPPSLSSRLEVPASAITDVIVDADGAKIGADRVRFPVTDYSSETRFYAADRAGSTLLLAVPEGRDPNAAFLLDQPRELPTIRNTSRDDTTLCAGFAVSLADPAIASAPERPQRPGRSAPGRGRRAGATRGDAGTSGCDSHLPGRRLRVTWLFRRGCKTRRRTRLDWHGRAYEHRHWDTRVRPAPQNERALAMSSKRSCCGLRSSHRYLATSTCSVS